MDDTIISFLTEVAKDEDGDVEDFEMEEYRDMSSIAEIADFGVKVGRIEMARGILDKMGIRWNDK